MKSYSQSALFGAGSKYCSHTQLRHFLETLVPLLQKVQPQDLRWFQEFCEMAPVTKQH